MKTLLCSLMLVLALPSAFTVAQPNLAATNKRVFNELATVLRAHIQRGGATPWQKPNR